MADKPDKTPNEPDLTALQMEEDGTLTDLLNSEDQIIHGRVPEEGNDKTNDHVEDDKDNDDLADDKPDDTLNLDDDLPEDGEPNKDKDSPDGDKKQKSGKTFASKEAAEAAYAELETKIGEQGTELGELRKEVKGIVADKAEPAVDPIKAINKSTAAKFAKLQVPPEGADQAAIDQYNEELVEVFADQTRQISEVQQVKATAVGTEQTRQVKYINSRLEKEDLGKYKDHFYSLARSVPSNIKSVEEAVDWGIKELKSVISLAESKKEDEQVAKDQEDSVMPGGKRRAQRQKSAKTDDMADVPDSIGGMIEHLSKVREIKEIH